MRTIPAALLAHLQQDVTTLAVCWQVTRRDGVVIRSTDHDRDIVISNSEPLAGLAGTYQATTGITGSSIRSADDLSVDNLEVQGQTTVWIQHLSPADIEAGLFDDARVVLFQCNWQAPDDGQIILRVGNLGNIRRNTDGLYRAELRGLAQRLSQITVRTYGVSCDADLGDARCGVDLDLYRITGTVTAVTSRRAFAADIAHGSSEPAAGFYSGGLITFTSGDNDGYSREIKTEADPAITTFEPFPAAIEIGDTFELTPGCNKQHRVEADGTVVGDCGNKFANVLNFRGHGWLIPGDDAITRAINTTPTGGGGGGKK